jgi:hypothetical protein
MRAAGNDLLHLRHDNFLCFNRMQACFVPTVIGRMTRKMTNIHSLSTIASVALRIYDPSGLQWLIVTARNS